MAVAILVLICLPFAFYPGDDASGWRVIPVYVIPVMALMLIWVLPFDMLMSRVFMGDKEGEERDRYKTVIKFDVFLLVMLFLFWAPFFLNLLTE
jgi:hypothetical protein